MPEREIPAALEQAWKVIEQQLQFVANGIEDANWIEVTIEIGAIRPPWGGMAVAKRFYPQRMGIA